jgi:hypothetical protein
MWAIFRYRAGAKKVQLNEMIILLTNQIVGSLRENNIKPSYLVVLIDSS